VVPRATAQGSGEEEIGLIGIGPAPESQFRRLNPVSAAWAGVTKTVDLSVLVVTGFVKLVKAKISPKTIGGPILIAQMAGEVAQRGIVELLFTALCPSIWRSSTCRDRSWTAATCSFLHRVAVEARQPAQAEIAQQVGMVWWGHGLRVL
jgi:hypothetical protein